MGKPGFAVLSEAVSGIEAPGLRVELGGDAVFLNAPGETSSHTAVGLLVALLVPPLLTFDGRGLHDLAAGTRTVAL